MDEPCTSRKLFMAAPMAIVVVYRHASLDILSPQVKSAPPQGSCLWWRPQAALWTHRHDVGEDKLLGSVALCTGNPHGIQRVGMDGQGSPGHGVGFRSAPFRP